MKNIKPLRPRGMPCLFILLASFYYLANTGHINAEETLNPLCIAVEHGDLERVEKAIHEGADLSVLCDDTPALSVSIKNGHEQIANLMIESGADISAQDENGFTPLHKAAKHNLYETARLLLDHGADVNALSERNVTPLNAALSFNPSASKAKLYSLLIEHGADVNIAAENGSTPFLQACGSESIELIKMLLQHGADVGQMDGHGRNAIIESSWGDSTRGYEVAQLLISSGADAGATSTSGINSLHSALYREQGHNELNLVKLLVEHGASVNQQESATGHSPLHLLAAKFHSPQGAAIIHYFSEHGADVNLKDLEGLTPLHSAVMNRNMDLVRALAQNGADFTIRDNRGRTPCDMDNDSSLEELEATYCKGAVQWVEKDPAAELNSTPRHIAPTGTFDNVLLHSCDVSDYSVYETGSLNEVRLLWDDNMSGVTGGTLDDRLEITQAFFGGMVSILGFNPVCELQDTGFISCDAIYQYYADSFDTTYYELLHRRIPFETVKRNAEEMGITDCGVIIQRVKFNDQSSMETVYSYVGKIGQEWQIIAQPESE